MKFRNLTRPSSLPIACLCATAFFITLCPLDAYADEQDAADAYRRLIFMVNLEPRTWPQITEQVDSIEHWLKTESDEAGQAYATETARLFQRLRRERSISLPTRVMQMQVGKTLIELSAGALATSLVSRLDRQASLEEAAILWRALEPEVVWAHPETAARFTRLLESPAEGETLQALREYLNENYLTEFRVVYHGALRPIPMTGHGQGLGPVPKPPLPPDSNLSHPSTTTLAELKEQFGDPADRTLKPIEIGRLAFHDSSIFGEPGRSMGISCASCHIGARPNDTFFIPGLSSRRGNADVTNNYFAKFNNNGAFDPLDIPGLEGLRHTGPFGRNGRFETLAEVVRNVIVREFGGEEPDVGLVEGMVAFLEQFEFEENEYLNTDGTLTDGAPAHAKRGEALFSKSFEQFEGKSCATCHNPADYFLDRQMHDIGTVAPGSPYAPDGRLDTPTLLGSTRSAPYMHDGRHQTLREVVEWFDTTFALDLNPDDLSSLTAYLELVGGAGADD